MSTLPAVPEMPALPALYDDVSVSDIQLPNIYLQTGQSQGVQNGVTKPGDVILGLGAGDEDPIFLITADKPSFEAYVIARKRFAATTADNRIVFHKDNKKDPDDPNSWEGFFYLLAMPDVDPDIPARIMLWKMAGRRAAQKINNFIERAKMQSSEDVPFTPPRVRFSLQNASSKTGIAYKQWAATLVQADEYLPQALEMMQFGSYLATENVGPTEDTRPAADPDAPAL